MPETMVRLATPADGPGILRLCHLLHQENGLFSMDDALVQAKLDCAFRQQAGCPRDGDTPSIIGVIGEAPDDIRGSIYLEMSRYWYTRDWHLGELWNFVHPAHRQSTYAVELLEYGKRCSAELGVPFITGIITNDRTESKVRLYRRALGYPAGAFFVVNGAWPQQASLPSFWKSPLDGRSKTRGGKRVRFRRSRSQKQAVIAG